MVVGKLDPTVGNFVFIVSFRGSAKRDHGNEFRGSKNGENEVGVGLKWPKNTKIRRPKLAAAAAFAGPIRARPTAASREILPGWSSGRPPPPCLERVQCWWSESAPTVETQSV